MNYIQKLPITAIKLDQSLVDGLGASPLSQSVIRNIIKATHEMNLTTVAEGVENKELFDLLADLGSDIAQGYYISKPLAEKDFDNWLTSCPWKL